MLATKETVHLGVLDEWEVVYIDKMESDHPFQMYSRIGRRAPLHCTALGKALVAWEAEDWLERFLRRRLRAYTSSTLIEPGEFRRELLKIRSVRYAFDGEEFAPGLKCVAAPLFDHSRRVGGRGLPCPWRQRRGLRSRPRTVTARDRPSSPGS